MAAPLFDLKDRAFIVTGAGRGIGAELAAGLAEAGAQVAVAGRTAADCEKVASVIAANGGRAIAAPFDARDEAQCTGLIERTIDTFGRLDGAVVNTASACTAMRSTPRAKSSPACWMATSPAIS